VNGCVDIHPEANGIVLLVCTVCLASEEFPAGYESAAEAGAFAMNHTRKCGGKA